MPWYECPQEESYDMPDRLSPSLDGNNRLRFACACATAVPVAQDPWVAIVNQRKLNDGTRERILNAIYDQPRTITQLAELLGISAPAVHRHVGEMFASDRATLQPILEDLAADIVAAFHRRQNVLESAFAQTSLPARGQPVEMLLHYLFATATRHARARLEADGALPAWPEHADGSRWIWWAEEAPETEVM